jgi:hypothetical protein
MILLHFIYLGDRNLELITKGIRSKEGLRKFLNGLPGNINPGIAS